MYFFTWGARHMDFDDLLRPYWQEGQESGKMLANSLRLRLLTRLSEKQGEIGADAQSLYESGIEARIPTSDALQSYLLAGPSLGTNLQANFERDADAPFLLRRGDKRGNGNRRSRRETPS